MSTAIVMGVGPDRGLGAQICHRFAQHGLHVVAAGRTQASLDEVAANITAAGGEASAIVADTTDESAVKDLFDTAATIGDVAVAIYNAGNNTPGTIVDMEADYFRASWEVCCFGGFLFGREAIRHMRSRGGTLLFTGASASLRGRPNFGAFNSAKAGLRTLAQAMAKEYGADDIHVGHVVVDGAVRGDKVQQLFPEYYEKLGEEGMVSIEGIVDAFEYLYRQPKTAWSFEIDVRTSIENW